MQESLGTVPSHPLLQALRLPVATLIRPAASLKPIRPSKTIFSRCHRLNGCWLNAILSPLMGHFSFAQNGDKIALLSDLAGLLWTSPKARGMLKPVLPGNCCRDRNRARPS